MSGSLWWYIYFKRVHPGPSFESLFHPSTHCHVPSALRKIALSSPKSAVSRKKTVQEEMDPFWDRFSYRALWWVGRGGPKKLVESLEIPILISQVMGHGEKRTYWWWVIVVDNMYVVHAVYIRHGVQCFMSVIFNFSNNHNKAERCTTLPTFHREQNGGALRFTKPRDESKWCLQRLLPFAFLLREHHSVFPVTKRGLLDSSVTLSTYYIPSRHLVLDTHS